MKLVNECGYTADRVRTEFKDAYQDKGILRWKINDEIPFQDLLADFRTLGLIDEETQLHSNLLREMQTDKFWEGVIR